MQKQKCSFILFVVYNNINVQKKGLKLIIILFNNRYKIKQIK